MTEHDVVVIGAGPAGEVCAGRLADEGLDVALVERELVGGECAFWACMPSKALLRPADVLAEVSRVPGATQAVTGKLDAAATLARRTEVIHDLDDSVKLPWLRDHEITLHRGPARLEGVRRVRVGDELLTARRAVVVAVGSGAVIPPIPGLRELAPWTNRQGTTAARVPDRLIVLGGGVVGCELAQAWSSLGARVTLVEAQPRLLSNEEPFAAEQLAQALRDRGVDVRLGAQVTAARRTNALTETGPDAGTETAPDAGTETAPDVGSDVGRRPRSDAASDPGVITVTLEGGDTIDGDELLVAVGRRPHTGDLGLETVDLEPGATISVDDRMRVTTPAHRDWLYAVGDVNGRALLTHAGKYQAMIATANIMNREAAAVWDGELSPRVVFTEPQIAAVGRTLQQALRDGITARAVDADPGATAAASFVGKGAPSGARIVVDQAREVIVGATFTGPDVADMLHAATVAIVGEVSLRRLVHVMPSFPTRSEVWLKLLEDWQP